RAVGTLRDGAPPCGTVDQVAAEGRVEQLEMMVGNAAANHAGKEGLDRRWPNQHIMRWRKQLGIDGISRRDTFRTLGVEGIVPRRIRRCDFGLHVRAEYRGARG